MKKIEVTFMKNYLALILSIIVVTVSISGCTSNLKDNEVKKFSGNNITFEYPAEWVIAESKANDTIVAVADPNSVDKQTGLAQTVVVIQKKRLEDDFYDMYNRNYATLFNNSSYQRVSEGNITLNGLEALENIYLSKENGTKKKYMAIWIQREEEVYVILCSALASEFDKEKPNFDIILNSFSFIK